MARKYGSLVWLVLLVGACGDDAETKPVRDAGGPDAQECPSGGSGTLLFDIAIDEGVLADVRVLRDSSEIAGGKVTASTSKKLDSGLYRIAAHRVRKTSSLVGSAYQAEFKADEICVKDGETTTVPVLYNREPGSGRLWLTQSNGSGTRVMAFDADQLATRGDQTPSISLSPDLTNAGPIRVDGLGRLWVGSNTGKLVAFKASRLGSTSSAAPDIVLEGDSLCDSALPCGPRAIAFDAKGALWVATLQRIVKLAPDSLNTSGRPAAAVTITSPDIETPNVLAFDAAGSLWVGESSGAILKFAASRLTSNIDNAAADTRIFAQQPGPVMLGLGSPEGMVFDGDGNLWVGYFAGNDLVRFSKAELATSRTAANPIIPSVYFKIGVEALVTDLALDEGGNLWLPGGAGAVYRVAQDQLSKADPMLSSLRSAEIGSVEKITFNTVPGTLFIAP